MRRTFIILLTFFILNCSSSSDCEKETYECLKKAYSDKDFDLEKNLNDLERALINQKYLKNSSYDSYIEFLQIYSDSLLKISGLEKLPKNVILSTKCICSDTTNKYYVFARSYFSSIYAKKNKVPIWELLSPEDFKNNPLYRTCILTNVYSQIDAKDQFGNYLIQLGNTTKSSESIVMDTISLNEKRHLCFNNTECSIEAIGKKVSHIKKVVIKANGDFTLGQIIALYDTLKKRGIIYIIK
jgi:hypothetical protein